MTEEMKYGHLVFSRPAVKHLTKWGIRSFDRQVCSHILSEWGH